MKANPDKYCLIPIVENIQGKLHYIKVISIYIFSLQSLLYKIDDEIEIFRQTTKRINYHDH